MKYLKISFLIIFLCYSYNSSGQQVPDTLYSFDIKHPAYLPGKGPLIFIDEAHNNFHKKETGFFAFAKLIEQDGYRVSSLNEQIGSKVLKGCEVLVIANALHQSNVGNWILPTPSAFTNEEINNLKSWVEDGGSLLLIADHMPFAGAASSLASAFGIEFVNGFAMTGAEFWTPSVFSLKDKTLFKSALTTGLHPYEEVDRVATFTGSAFKAPENAIPVLVFKNEHRSLQPDTAWRFNRNTHQKELEDHYQGAIMNFGKGKVAVFGEAAMFTAQVSNKNFKAGFNSEYAPKNAQFVLNVIHWLDDIKEYSGSFQKEGKTTEEAVILRLNKEMEEAFHANDFEKVAEFYLDEGVMVGNKHEIKGKENIDTYWLNLKDRGVSWQLENIDLEVHDEVAIQRGISRMKYLYNEKEYLSEVRFTLIWKKVNNKWKIALDHYSLL